MEAIRLSFPIDGENFTAAGTASVELKRTLKKIGLPQEIVRRISICMYEGEINMVIHANGGVAEAEIAKDKIVLILKDNGPGIPDVNKAMEEGYSTASEMVRNLGFGAGMGLPNMKKNSDEIHIDTTPGVGTTVTMTIYTA